MKRRKFPLIFIVEDDPFYAAAIQKELEKVKLNNIQIYDNGQDAIYNMYQIPEIVLLDYSLGDSDGITVLDQIKKLYPNIQVIFLSAQEKLEVAIKSLKHGAFDYIEKDSNGLSNMIHSVKKLYQLNCLIVENRKYQFFTKFSVPIFMAMFVLVVYLTMLITSAL